MCSGPWAKTRESFPRLYRTLNTLYILEIEYKGDGIALGTSKDIATLSFTSHGLCAVLARDMKSATYCTH